MNVNGDTAPFPIRALTMLNETGDTTLVWTSDRDEEMERIIEQKMAEGCAFYIIEPRFGTREILRDARDASRNRMLAIPDADFAKFVGVSSASASEPVTAAAVTTPEKPVKGARRAKTSKEVASSESVGVRPRRGG